MDAASIVDLTPDRDLPGQALFFVAMSAIRQANLIGCPGKRRLGSANIWVRLVLPHFW